MCNNLTVIAVEDGVSPENQAKCRSKETWEVFSDFFGNRYPMMIVAVAHSAFFMSTVTMFWPSPALPKLFEMDDNPLGRPITPDESDLIGSLLYVGAAVGPLLVFGGVKILGRKFILCVLFGIMPITYLTFMFAEMIELYYICRILQGIYCGAVVSIQPVYLAEIMGEEESEFLLSLATVFGAAGMLATYCLGPFIPLLYFNGSVFLLSTLCIMLLIFGFPESPYYVMRTKGKESARVILKVLRKGDIQDELNRIEEVVKSDVKSSQLKFFTSTKYIKPFLLGTTPLLIQVFTGASILQTYSELIFQQTNIALSSSVCSIITGCFQFSTVFLTPVLLKSKKFTMKSLFILCLSGMTFSNIVITCYFMFCQDNPDFKWLSVFGLIIFIPFYNCGLDPIPVIILSQIYPKNVDSIGIALSTSIYCLVNFPLLFIFSKVSMGMIFLGSTVCCVLGILYGIFIFTSKTELK